MCVFYLFYLVFMLLVKMYFTSHLIISMIFTFYNYFIVLFKIAFCQNDNKRVIIIKYIA